MRKSAASPGSAGKALIHANLVQALTKGYGKPVQSWKHKMQRSPYLCRLRSVSISHHSTSSCIPHFY